MPLKVRRNSFRVRQLCIMFLCVVSNQMMRCYRFLRSKENVLFIDEGRSEIAICNVADNVLILREVQLFSLFAMFSSAPPLIACFSDCIHCLA